MTERLEKKTTTSDKEIAELKTEVDVMRAAATKHLNELEDARRETIEKTSAVQELEEQIEKQAEAMNESRETTEDEIQAKEAHYQERLELRRSMEKESETIQSLKEEKEAAERKAQKAQAEAEAEKKVMELCSPYNFQKSINMKKNVTFAPNVKTDTPT